jgi:uncharacterized protein
MLFVFFCTDKPDHAEVRATNRQAHLDYLGDFVDQVVLAGPTLGDNGASMTGSVLVLDFATRAEADAFAANDPYNKAGLFDSVVVRPFKKVLPES